MILFLQNLRKFRLINSIRKKNHGQKGWEEYIIKGYKDTFWGNGYVHYIDCGNDFMGVYICTFYYLKIIPQ